MIYLSMVSQHLRHYRGNIIMPLMVVKYGMQMSKYSAHRLATHASCGAAGGIGAKRIAWPK